MSGYLSGLSQNLKLFQGFDDWKIEWLFHIRYCVNFKFRNLPYSCMKNDSDLDTVRRFPFKNRQDSDASVFRCLPSPTAKSIDGQPQVHLPTTMTSSTCEAYCRASGLPLAISHSSRDRSSLLSALCSGRMNLDMTSSNRAICLQIFKSFSESID